MKIGKKRSGKQMSSENRITLFLMSYKGLKVLETFGAEFSDTVDFVVTARDASIQDDYCEEIRQTCKRLDIKCFDRQGDFRVTSGYALAVSWRWLINLSATKLIVFHDSLLPKYRGFNPLVSYLINEEKEIGVTALFAADEYDVGDIIVQSSSEISYPLRIADAIESVSDNYVALARKIGKEISLGRELNAKMQNEAEASYSLWRDEEDYRIDWSQPARKIRRFIDAVGFPYQGASSLIEEKKVRIFDAEELADVTIKNRTTGKVIFLQNGFPVVVCGEGLLKILSLVDDETRQSVLPLRRFRTRFN